MRRVLLAAVAALVMTGPAAAQELALTFDDLPAHSALPPGESRVGVIARIVAALADAGAPPTMGFINASGIEDVPSDRAVLEIWRGAGHPLGNHTWSHANLDAVGVEAFEAEIIRNEPLLQELAGGTEWRWFRYPFLAEGQTQDVRNAVRGTLRQRGYKIASVTMDFSDWAFNEPYARCRAAGDEAGIARLEALYMTAAEEALSASRALSDTLYDRDIPYVLLMHAGAFDARMLPRLLALYRERGMQLVPLEHAMDDVFYDADTAISESNQPLTLEGAARARGLPVPVRMDVQAEIRTLCP